MNCIICNSTMEYYFSKVYSTGPFVKMMSDIGKVDYYRCPNCGFVHSKTHCELPNDKWVDLNTSFHHYSEYMKKKMYSEYIPSSETKLSPPPHLQEAVLINLLSKNKIINATELLDYGCGYGTLHKILKKYFNIETLLYEPYVTNNLVNYIRFENLAKYNTVYNGGMFEHIISADVLRHLCSLIDTDGCLIIHTVICENIPADPDWFYLNCPVHCAFHTNKSMEIFMKDNGFVSSLYSPVAKCWVLFRKDPDNIVEKITAINVELQLNYLYYKKGFVDYWKGF